MRGIPALALLALTTLTLAGCTDGGGSGSASVYVKDQPTDEFKEIHLNFTRAEVHLAGDGGDGGGDGNESGTWRVVFESEGTDIDLLQATGDLAAFLGEVGLEAGRYTQVRITVDSAWGIKQDDTRVDIVVSSGTVKTSRSFEVPADAEARIVVDLDLDRSLVRQGGGPEGIPVPVEEERWRLTPVIGSVTVEEVDDDESGSDVHEEGEVAAVAGT